MEGREVRIASRRKLYREDSRKNQPNVFPVMQTKARSASRRSEKGPWKRVLSYRLAACSPSQFRQITTTQPCSAEGVDGAGPGQTDEAAERAQRRHAGVRECSRMLPEVRVHKT